MCIFVSSALSNHDYNRPYNRQKDAPAAVPPTRGEITVCMHIQFAVAITLLHGNNFLCNTER